MNKLRLVFLIACIVFPFVSHGQADTIYYDSDGNRADFDNADFYRIIQDRGKRYRVEDHFLNNKLKMTGYYIALDTNNSAHVGRNSSVRDGLFISYDKNGFIISEGSYEKNQFIGEWKHYYEESNKIWYVEHYSNGKMDGELLSYYKDGELKRREVHVQNDTAISGKCFDKQGNEIPFTQFEILPHPTFNMQHYLSTNLQYPNAAKEKGIEGRVIVKFIINVDGSISDVRCIRSIGGGCDEEAVRVLSAMPKWTVSIKDDEKVKCPFTLPIVFKLN